MIGVLCLPQRLQANSPKVSSKGTVFQHDELLEFMISKGFAVVRDDPNVLMEKKDIRQRQPVDDVHEFYNVLWIERDKDGVARCQGLGRIFREAWDLEVGDEKALHGDHATYSRLSEPPRRGDGIAESSDSPRRPHVSTIAAVITSSLCPFNSRSQS
jgi:hypothetical protein